MTFYTMLHLVQSQLATDMNCTIDDLNGKTDAIIFTEFKDNPGRRRFPRSELPFEMLSMGKTIVVSASPMILEMVKPLLIGKSRDEAFSMPFVYGHSLCYLPDQAQIKPLASPEGFVYEFVEQSEIPMLYRYEGFNNCIQYDAGSPRSDILVMLAKKNGKIAGMAGASSDCAAMWQVGIDVLPEHRNQGLAAYLVNQLSSEILERGYVPYYVTASSNIASQRVAHRAGYLPAWVCAYKGKFDFMEYSPTS